MTTNKQPTTTTTTRSLLEELEVSDEMAQMLARMEAQKSDPRAMTADERAGYVATLCKALHLNPLTRPAQFINLSGREVLYLTRTATDQLAAMHNLNRKTIDGPRVVDVCGTKVGLCTVEVSLPSGRSETATATLPAADFVNLYMKLETKAKRRGTLSILGLGVLGEDEIETIPDAKPSTLNATPAQEPTQRRANPLDGLGIEAPPKRPQNAAETPAQRDHIREATAHVGGDNPTLGEHNRAAAEAQAMPDAPAWRVALDALANDAPALVAFCNDAERAQMPGTCGAVWLKHRAEIAAFAADIREAAWKALVARCESVGQKGAKVWLKRYVAEADAKRAQTDAPAATEVQS